MKDAVDKISKSMSDYEEECSKTLWEVHEIGCAEAFAAAGGMAAAAMKFYRRHGGKELADQLIASLSQDLDSHEVKTCH